MDVLWIINRKAPKSGEAVLESACKKLSVTGNPPPSLEMTSQSIFKLSKVVSELTQSCLLLYALHCSVLVQPEPQKA